MDHSFPHAQLDLPEKPGQSATRSTRKARPACTWQTEIVHGPLLAALNLWMIDVQQEGTVG
jgi:hypothetical protein